MNGYDQPRSPEYIVDRLLTELGEDRLRRHIDDRLDAAVSGFKAPVGPIGSQQAFLRMLGVFIRRLYRTGLRIPRRLSSAQARAEAIALLESYYRSAHDLGYEAALLDAADPTGNGLQGVLGQLAQIIRQRERERYARWIVCQFLAPCSWTEKCAVVRHFIGRCQKFLPPNLRRTTPAQLVEELPALLTLHLQTEDWLVNLGF